jgi:E3 ubiquitin-protein ligase RNF115/126
MAQYLMALLGQRDPSNEMFGPGLGDLADGRMGDYVFNQEGNVSRLTWSFCS